MSEADLSEANVSKSLLVKANLSHTRFVETCLDGPDLRGVQAQAAYFSKASLKNADLRDARFAGATLYRTNLNGAWLYAPGLERATLQMTDLPSLIKKKSL